MDIKDISGNGRVMSYEFATPTAAGERLVVDLEHCDNPGGNSIPHRWFKAGRTPVEYADWISVKTYATDAEGNCYGRYNPAVRDCHLYFDWVLPDTADNRARILRETARLAGIDFDKEVR